MFDDAPGHLYQLMNPDIAVIGADQLEVDLGSFFGIAYIACVDTRSAAYRAHPRRPRVYTYLGPNGTIPANPPPYREGPGRGGPLIFAYFDGPKRATVTLRSLMIRFPDGSVRAPSQVLFTGGLRDGRGAHRALAAKGPTGKPSSPQPATVIEVGPEIGTGPYKLKIVYEYREPGHQLVYSTTVPASATVYGTGGR